MIENYMFDRVNEYINNEINSIERDMITAGFDKTTINDLHRLINLKEEEIKEIADKVINDNELTKKVNEIIHYYIYH